MADERLLDATRRLTAALGPAGMDATLANITAAAVEVLPDVQMASITVLHQDGRLDTRAPTHDVLVEVDAAQYELREGPCYQAAQDDEHIISPNLAADPRFPRYAPVALHAGIRAQAGVQLFGSRDGAAAALNLYSHRVGAFEDMGILTNLFSHQAAMALAYARHIDNLDQAIESRQRIGQAVGIIMERYGLEEARAFAVLTRLSQESNTKIRVLADRMITEQAASD